LLAWGGAALAQDSESPWSGTVAVVSDYAFRGVSQSDEDPALQASVTYTDESGFYAGVWASTVDFDPSGTSPADEIGADVEVDLYVGYGWSFTDDWAGDVSVVYYLYPGTENDIDLDYLELIAKLTYRDLLTASVGYSNDVFNSGQDGTWFNLSGNWELPHEFLLHGGVGLYDFDGAVFGSDAPNEYFEWAIGVSRDVGPVTLDVTYVDTDDDGEDLFGDYAGSRVIASATYSW
jgi:uncharacterized protein (TIGR02001 family)